MVLEAPDEQSTEPQILAWFAQELRAFDHELADWSQATFGTDEERGPIGPLKHLELEAREAQESLELEEFADCFTLIVDASRRAGFSFPTVAFAAMEKLEVNKQREWPTPTSDEPVGHVK